MQRVSTDINIGFLDRLRSSRPCRAALFAWRRILHDSGISTRFKLEALLVIPTHCMLSRGSGTVDDGRYVCDENWYRTTMSDR